MVPKTEKIELSKSSIIHYYFYETRIIKVYELILNAQITDTVVTKIQL